MHPHNYRSVMLPTSWKKDSFSDLPCPRFSKGRVLFFEPRYEVLNSCSRSSNIRVLIKEGVFFIGKCKRFSKNNGAFLA